jgi:hypothetical protein
LRLKGVAEGLGFIASIEKQIQPGAESVDLLLERPPLNIACEISVTSTVDQEVGNVRKCLRADFSRVVVIALDGEKLRKIEAAVRNSIGPEAADKVSFHTPDSLIEALQKLALEPLPSAAGPVKRRGYTVKKTFVTLSPEEAKAREQAAAELLFDPTKRRPRDR